MAKGRPTKWATATVTQPIGLGRAGIKVVVWDKWGRTRLGTAVISVGGLRWTPFKKQKAFRISWNRLSEMASGP